MRYFPLLLALAGCFLPDARYSLQGQSFSTRAAADYSGWIVLCLLTLTSAWFAFNHWKQKPAPVFISAFSGIYLLGFALFRGWNTFFMFSNPASTSLAAKMQATAIPAEGLLLLVLAGLWLLRNALVQKKY